MKRTVDLSKELAAESARSPEIDELLVEASEILLHAEQEDESITRRLQGRGAPGLTKSQIRALDQDRIVTLPAIKKVCSRFRLRFLESKYFKGEIPYEAYPEIKKIEQKTGAKFESFYVVAPESRFQLLDSTKDPVLLARLTDQHYYFIYKWGNDMQWHRSILNFPFRNMLTLGITCFLLGLTAAISIPDTLIPQFYHQTAPLTLLAKSFVWFISASFFFVFTLIFGILTSRDFSENVWNDKYFN